MDMKINGSKFIHKSKNTAKAIFEPIVPIIIVWGFMLGAINVMNEIKLFGYGTQSLTDVYPLLNVINDFLAIICDYIVHFIPVAISWSTVKVLGGYEILGIILGVILVSPRLLDSYGYMQGIDNNMIPIGDLKILDLKKVGYQAQLLPAIISAILLVKIENRIIKYVSSDLKLYMIRSISLLVTSIISYNIIGPMFDIIDDSIAKLFYYILIGEFKLIGAMLFSMLYSLLVILGIHHTFLSIDLELVREGGTMIWPLITLCNIAQGSAAISVFILCKSNLKMKCITILTGICAFVGVTEPAIFGVNLKYKYGLYSALIGAIVASIICISRDVLAEVVGVSGLIGIISIQTDYRSNYILPVIVALVLPFIVLLYFIKEKKFNV